MRYDYEKIYCEIEDKIGVITLNNAPVNVLDSQMLRDLRNLMTELENAEDLRCVIVTGAGEKSFCAGADVGELTDPTVDDLEETDTWARGIMTRFSNLPFPTIAAINGYALGGGMELALACDIRIASTKAKMGLTETKLGMIAGWTGSQRMPRIVGISQAKKMMFTAEMLKADAALNIGLVSDVVEPEELMNFSMELAKKIAANSPVANRLAKASVNHYMNIGMYEGLELERKCDRATYESEDSKEGMLAFEEKRTPNFKNR